MTKSDLVDAVANASGITGDRAAIVVNAFFEQMIDAMTRGERIEIRDFGNFVVKKYDGYTGRNPATGARVTVGPKRLPFFKAGLRLKAAINDKKRAR